MNLCPQIQAPDPKVVKLSGDISKAQAKEECGNFKNAKWEALVQQAEEKTVLRKGSQDTERMEASRKKTSATRSQEKGIKDECLSRRLRQRTDWNKA